MKSTEHDTLGGREYLHLGLSGLVLAAATVLLMHAPVARAQNTPCCGDVNDGCGTTYDLKCSDGNCNPTCCPLPPGDSCTS
jgi:hypothetical protein